MSGPVIWKKPNISCPHKIQVHNLKVNPDVKSPHNFTVGLNEIRYIFELYGGLKKSCDIMIYVQSCKVKNKGEFYSSLLIRTATDINMCIKFPKCFNPSYQILVPVIYFLKV